MTIRTRISGAIKAFRSDRAAAAAAKAFVVDSPSGQGMSIISGETLGMFLRQQRGRFDPSTVDATLSPVVMACLATITRNFGQASPMVYRRRKVGEAPESEPDHWCSKLLRRPSQQLTLGDLWGSPLIDYSTDGNGYWRKGELDRRGRPAHLFPLPGATVLPRFYGDRRAPSIGPEFVDRWIARYDVWDQFQGRTEMVPAEEIVHMRTELDWRRGGRLGIPPFRSVALEVHCDNEAGNYESAVLQNMGAALFISPQEGDTNYSAAEVDSYQQKVDAAIGGGNRGKVFYSNVRVDAKDVGRSPRDMRTSEMRAIYEDRTAAVLNVPLLCAGFGTREASTYQNQKTAFVQLWDTCLIPMQNDIAEDLTICLLAPEEIDAGYFIGFDRKGVAALDEDETERRKRDREDFEAGGLDYHEYRQRLGLPSEGLPNFYLVPAGSTQVPVGQMPTPTAPPVTPGEIMKALKAIDDAAPTLDDWAPVRELLDSFEVDGYADLLDAPAQETT